MRWSKSFIPTLKEDPADAEVISHKLLVRAGFVRQVSRGIYNFLPLGLRVLKKIETIVRQEMDHAGAQELLLPIASPAELWQESGRWELYGKELLRFKDRHDRDFCLGPTHEEVITDLVRRIVRSYRELPFNLYQIQTKFRDEVRPRFGLMRGREFIMKDAYSFHVDVADCMREYESMFGAYKRIFERCGLRFRAVEADTGAIGGTQSHEFQVLADSGEDAIVSCTACEYAANAQKAEIRRPRSPDGASESPALKKVATPGKKTVDEVAAFLGLPRERFIKTLIYKTDQGELVAALVRGDHELNELKLAAALGCREVLLANESEIGAVTHATAGFLGPIGLRIRVVADWAIEGMRGAVTGANEADVHYTGVDQRRDFAPALFADLRFAVAGEACPRCDRGVLESYRGIEVGQIFYLGTKYSDALGARYLDAAGRERSIEMGCYGIGVSRLIAAAIEQHHDGEGMIWPFSIAPFEVLVLPINYKERAMRDAADRLYTELLERNVQVLLDDREERPGVKFKDADLIGIPLRVTVGPKGLQSGSVELRWRRDGRTETMPVEQASTKIREIVAAHRRG